MFSAILLGNANSYIFLVPFEYASIFQNTFREGRIGSCRQIQGKKMTNIREYLPLSRQNQLWTEVPTGELTLIAGETTIVIKLNIQTR